MVTGGTGFIGRWLLAELTRRGQRTVAVVRDAKRRQPELRAFVRNLGGIDELLHIEEGDVLRPDLGLGGASDSEVGDVYHLAARFDFGLTVEEARAANVDGTLNVLEWARKQRRLRRFVYLGGYRMTKPPAALKGLRFPLTPAARSKLYRDHGAYEASKYESYAAFRSFMEQHKLPWTVVHPSGVTGDSRSGRTTQVVGLGETVERLWQGRLPALVGSTKTFVPVVTVDHLAAVLASVPVRKETLGTELTVLDQTTPELPELIATLAKHLSVPVPNHLLPVSLVRHLPTAITGLSREALGFLSEDRYDTISGDAHAAAAGLALPDLSQSLTRWCDELVSTRFGASPQADRGLIHHGTFTVGNPQQAEFLFLHGLPWNGDAFRPVVNRLEQPSLRVDLPGLGRSAGAPADETGERWLLGVLESRTRPLIVVGHSLGASTAVRFALAHPERVSALVLIAPPFLLKPASRLARLTPAVAHVLRHSNVEQLATRLLPGGLTITQEVRETLESASYDLKRTGVACRTAQQLAKASAAASRSEVLQDAAKLRCPVHVINGSLEPLTQNHPWDASTIDGGGHAVHVSHPNEVAAILRSTWSQLRPKGA